MGFLTRRVAAPPHTVTDYLDPEVPRTLSLPRSGSSGRMLLLTSLLLLICVQRGLEQLVVFEQYPEPSIHALCIGFVAPVMEQMRGIA
jgi:hypothetical protein